MHKNPSVRPESDIPFLDLLAEAEEIKVREISPENRPKLPTIESSLSDFTDKEGSHRTFFVRIRTKPSSLPQEAPEPPQWLDEPSNNGNRQYLLKSAALLVQEEDFLLARNIYSYFLKSDANDVEALKGLGQCLLRLGDIAAAKKCFQALKELRDSEDIYLWIGACYVAEGNDSTAAQQFRKIQRPSDLPNNSQFELYKELGNCENRLGNFDEAWTQYHKAMSIQPNSDTVYVNLGTLEFQRQHNEVALSYFHKAIELNPKSSRGHCGLGLISMSKKDSDTAEKAFSQALDLDSQNLVAIFQILLLCELRSEYSVAKDRIAQFLAKDPKNHEVRLRLATILFKESDFSACDQELDTILAADPKHAKAMSLKQTLISQRHLPT